MTLLKDNFLSQKISFSMIGESDLLVNGYPNEFSQAILNILLNARDALAERNVAKPRIVISLEASGEGGAIVIADNAGGIPDEVIGRVFDPYFTTKEPQHGTGLGLYMAKMIIEKNMGGRLAVRNGSEGAEFRIEVYRDRR
jgi:hypothetical protein